MHTWRRILICVLLALGLLWLNAYIARDLFISGHTGKTNSMHGYWTAMARHATLRHWLWPSWWPYWDGGMPFEWTYAPLVPALTSLHARLTGADAALSFGWVTGWFYCFTPVTLFVCAAVLSRKLVASFAAGVLYSLTAPTQMILPDAAWKLAQWSDARRLYLVASWDEAPHVAALTFLPLVVLFTALGLSDGRTRWWLLASVSMSLCVLANAFGATAVVLTLCCVLVAWGANQPLASMARITAAGALGWCMIAGWLPFSQISSMRAAAETHGHGWSLTSITALALVLCAATLAWACCRRLWRCGAWGTFIALFATLMLSIPAIYIWTERQFLPQSGRYKVEAELGLALALAFGIEALLRRTPVPVKAAVCLLGLAVAVEQTVKYRKYEKLLVHSADMQQTIEGRIAAFFQRTMPDARVAVPGSLAQWLNNFGPQQQFAGSSWSTAYNPEQQNLNSAWQGATTPEEVTASLALLREFGVSAYAVPGPASPEFWKAVAKPELHANCETLWMEQDTRVCRLPNTGDALVQPAGQLRWRTANEFAVSAATSGAATSIRITWHPGWRAYADGKQLVLSRDQHGLIRLEKPPAAPGAIRFVYDGGWELKLTRMLMYSTWFLLLAYVVRRLRRGAAWRLRVS
ncbi:MAG TPA: hypothetical protein VES20_12480 [Bryobacteraceae bacterium]|nr:hypothetical protein [Bryobacteraceae bacterium]